MVDCGPAVYNDQIFLWDATFQGVSAPAGVYAYRLMIDKKFEINDSETITY
ncbi:hypothetical protein SAMN05216327_10257 [Dyadobacter sp. SG02]|nr:hypothetical protein SAMN05216327_10257 [Dyadobacter sp. SG02]